ncbi:MAG: hypothetical protein JWQ19_2529, partial [Subtercola sp.]|nr:hypothetical protein [Subtercola sp.]MCU1481574.1 hypothetical protein [Subtercola sp.]MCU1481743.1 hypothetical protein [Subtercola sp.]
ELDAITNKVEEVVVIPELAAA